MKFERNEVLTGALVISTVGLLVAVILLLSAPGIFHPLVKYRVFFDNASGLTPGSPVFVAGRKIGQVAGVDSPVPKALRPAKYPDDEVLITLTVNRGSVVYRNATARMQQNGLLGQQIIDFVGGTEESGDAENGYTFVGTRVPDLNSSLPKILAVIEPVASTAELTLSDLRKTIDSLNAVFGKEGDLRGALDKLRATADNLNGLTAPDGALSLSLGNVRDLTGKLKSDDGPLVGTLNNLQKTTADINKDDRLEKMLTNFQSASTRANDATKNVNQLLTGIRPSVQKTTENLAEMTDTLKRQPWRLLWPSTKKYQVAATDANAPAANPSPASTRHTRRVTVRNGSGDAATAITATAASADR